MSRTVNVSEAKAQLSALIQQVQSGEPVVIANAGRPVAVLSAFSVQSTPRPMGGWQNEDVWISDDFDGPLPAEIQAHFEGSA